MAHEAFIKKFDLDNRVKTPNPGIRRFLIHEFFTPLLNANDQDLKQYI
tara:strand:- start:5 stop:148 length:144 start_codon:yes stop_codon:yes gene_type:complete